MSRNAVRCALLICATWGLPHGLVAPSRLRTAAHDAVHDAVVRHVGRKALDARHACAARARLLRDLVSSSDLEAAVDLSLSLGAEFRASLPEGCVLEDRPHAGFANVVTKVQRERNGTRGERISHVQLAAGEPFSTSSTTSGSTSTLMATARACTAATSAPATPRIRRTAT